MIWCGSWLFHALLQAETAGRWLVFLSRMLDLTLIIVHHTTAGQTTTAASCMPTISTLRGRIRRLASSRHRCPTPIRTFPINLFPFRSPLRSRRCRRRRVLPVVVDFITSGIRRDDVLDLICISARPVVVNVQRSALRPPGFVPSGPVHRLVRPAKSHARAAIKICGSVT